MCALIEFLIFEELVTHVAISTNRSSYWLQCCHSYHTIIMACAYGSLLHALFTTRHKNRVVSKLFVSLLAAIQLSTKYAHCNFFALHYYKHHNPMALHGIFFFCMLSIEVPNSLDSWENHLLLAGLSLVLSI